MNKVDIQKSSVFPPSAVHFGGTAVIFAELKTEIVRKSIHFLVALTPSLAVFNRTFTVFFLMIGTLGYTYMEILRMSGVKVPVISSLTRMASRTRDLGHFVLGPVTLGLGALLALLLYPSPAASIGIYALAFGDGLASLVGKSFGKIRPAFLCGKSVEGSLACFAAVLFCTYQVSRSFSIALIAAFTAMAVEALPMEDYDNLALPVTVGMVAQLALQRW
ncbi:MAG: phosphatidate cytidylyltransferase [Treponema sp.]|jgi:dolichol kinase|nr:phosphatidate cytidylyltransferase [Treponema sp.]